MKLDPFCDGWAHRYAYKGDLSPGAIYHCNKNVTEWGIEWIEEEGGVSRVAPKLHKEDTSNQTHGLTIIEMQGLDENTVLLVIEEQVPKSKRSRIYGCILDYSKLNLELCKSCTRLGLLHSKKDSKRWTPKLMLEQLNMIQEVLAEKNPKRVVDPVIAQTPSPKKKTAKRRKTLVGAPGDSEKQSEKELTIAQCVKMEEPEIRKLSPKALKVMKSLYTSVFDPLYIWGKKPLADPFGDAQRVHFDYLHQAPVATLVYRGIEETRLTSMINKARLDTDFDSEFRYITVFPMKLGPYGPKGTAKFFDVQPNKEFLSARGTHYYIIGGQHTVEAYKTLVQNDEIQECDKMKASTFQIVPIWAPRSKWNDIIMLSRALNQNIAGAQREQCFTKQLVNARLKWREMGSSQPAYGGRVHSDAYMVELAPPIY